MKILDETELLSICHSLRHAADRLNQAATELSNCIPDPIGATPRLERARDRVIRVQEVLEIEDSALGAVIDRVKTCWHPEELWKEQNGMYTCQGCGSLWTGLRWSKHSSDEELRKD